MTTYPLAVPSTAQFAKMTFRRSVVASEALSPITLKRQVFQWPGERWEAELTLAPMTRAQYAPWAAFFLSLDGPVGTFLLGPPDGQIPLGSARNAPGTPQVNGGAQYGESLNIKGLPVNAVNYLRAGDYVQLGSAGLTRLFMLTTDVSADGSGNATLDLRPRVRQSDSPADGATLVVQGAQGQWNLVSPSSEWSVDASMVAAGFTFAVREPR